MFSLAAPKGKMQWAEVFELLLLIIDNRCSCSALDIQYILSTCRKECGHCLDTQYIWKAWRKTCGRSSEDPVKQKTGTSHPERIPGADLAVYLRVSFLLSVIIIVGA